MIRDRNRCPGGPRQDRHLRSIAPIPIGCGLRGYHLAEGPIPPLPSPSAAAKGGVFLPSRKAYHTANLETQANQMPSRKRLVRIFRRGTSWGGSFQTGATPRHGWFDLVRTPHRRAEALRLHGLSLAVGWLATLAGALECHAAEPTICVYSALLSRQDRFDAQGRALQLRPDSTSMATLLRQDRANFHALHKRDPEDTADCLFSTLAARQRLPELLRNGVLEPGLVDRIPHHDVLVQVQIFPERIRVAALPHPVHQREEPLRSPTPPHAAHAPEGSIRRCVGTDKASCVDREGFRHLCGRARGTTARALSAAVSIASREADGWLFQPQNLRAHHVVWTEPEDRCTYQLHFSAKRQGRHHFATILGEVSAFIEVDGNILASEIGKLTYSAPGWRNEPIGPGR